MTPAMMSRMMRRRCHRHRRAPACAAVAGVAVGVEVAAEAGSFTRTQLGSAFLEGEP